MPQLTIEGYVQLVADALGLEGWEFDLCKGAKHNHYASIIHNQETREARITFNAERWQKRTPAQRRHLVCHELGHARLGPLAVASEQQVDSFASKVAPLLPLPPEDLDAAELPDRPPTLPGRIKPPHVSWADSPYG